LCHLHLGMVERQEKLIIPRVYKKDKKTLNSVFGVLIVHVYPAEGAHDEREALPRHDDLSQKRRQASPSSYLRGTVKRRDILGS